MTCNNPNVYLINMNAYYIQFGEILSICSQDIEWKRNFGVNQGFAGLFDLILYVPSTIFQLNRDGSSWVEPVLS